MSEHPKHDEGDDEFARGLPGALRAVSDDFPGPSPDLVVRGHTRGRRLRRNRNIRVGVAAGALVAVALGGTYAVVGLGDDSVAPVAKRPTATASVTPPDAAGAELLAILKSLLPPGGSFSAESGRGTQPDPERPNAGIFASLVYESKKGTSGVHVEISRFTGTPGCPKAQVAPHAECLSETLEDGSSLIPVRNYTYPGKAEGQRHWYAEHYLTNGVAVKVSVFGGGAEKATTNPANPILSMDEIKAVAKSDKWAPAIAAVENASDPDPPELPSKDVVALLKTFAPAGAVISNEESQPGRASLIVDDGNGRSSLSVSVQTDMTADLGPIFTCAGRGKDAKYCDADTLADGSKLLLMKMPSEKGGTAEVWMADMLRPDGVRVLASSINSYAEAAEPTRAEPALSLAQLKTLVTDTRWLEL